MRKEWKKICVMRRLRRRLAFRGLKQGSAHSAALIVGKCLMKFLVSVHHKGTVRCHRFIQRFTGQKEQFRFTLGFQGDCISVTFVMQERSTGYGPETGGMHGSPDYVTAGIEFRAHRNFGT